MAGTATATKPKPRLKSLDGLFGLNEDEPRQAAHPEPDAAQSQGDTYLTTMPFSAMQDFPGHPFRLYDGERKADMTDSIRDKGVLQPLIIRETDEGEFHILSGHNRKYCGLEAGKTEAPVIVKRNLTDEEALIYVIETNLLQRSFADMLPSEKAAVLALEHSKLFSQGKRDDILSELERLANHDNDAENPTCAQIAHKVRYRVYRTFSCYCKGCSTAKGKNF